MLRGADVDHDYSSSRRKRHRDGLPIPLVCKKALDVRNVNRSDLERFVTRLVRDSLGFEDDIMAGMIINQMFECANQVDDPFVNHGQVLPLLRGFLSDEIAVKTMESLWEFVQKYRQDDNKSERLGNPGYSERDSSRVNKRYALSDRPSQISERFTPIDRRTDHRRSRHTQRCDRCHRRSDEYDARESDECGFCRRDRRSRSRFSGRERDFRRPYESRFPHETRRGRDRGMFHDDRYNSRPSPYDDGSHRRNSRARHELSSEKRGSYSHRRCRSYSSERERYDNRSSDHGFRDHRRSKLDRRPRNQSDSDSDNRRSDSSRSLSSRNAHLRKRKKPEQNRQRNRRRSSTSSGYGSCGVNSSDSANSKVDSANSKVDCRQSS